MHVEPWLVFAKAMGREAAKTVCFRLIRYTTSRCSFASVDGIVAIMEGR